MAAKGTWIEKDMIRSAPYRLLSKSDSDVLLEFMCRIKKKKMPGKKMNQRWCVINNGEIVFTYGEAEKLLGISRSTFKRAIDKLVDCGFIDIAHQGGALEGDASLYGISKRWQDYGTSRFVSAKRVKDNRGLGITTENWEARTGKMRKIKISDIIDTGAVPKKISLRDILG